MFLKAPVTLVLVAILLPLLAACGAAATPNQVPTPTSTPIPTQSPPTSEGQRLFISKGCAACHGQKAEGTSIAPALAGHTAQQVRRQVRAPLGTMPVFPPDKVSDEELEAIVEFIEGLEGGHGHVRAGGSGEELVLHHWMALFSMEAGDNDEAMHHVGHILELAEGEHEARMQEAQSLLEAGDMHEAAHTVEEMLAGMEIGGLDETTMHLRLALSSARVEDTKNAIHQMEHYTEKVSGPRMERGEEILSMIHGDMMHEAEHEMEELLGEASPPAGDGH